MYAVLVYLLPALVPSVFADSESPLYVLDPIVKEGGASDALSLDPVLPSRRARINQDQATGSVERSFSGSVALPVTEYGRAGSVSAIRGLGRSTEDTQIEMLGIPLNKPEGLGVDLSIFPQYMWSDLSYQIGPVLGSYDPRAVSGTVSLTPWTVSALGREPGERSLDGKISATYSTLKLGQLAVGARAGDIAAIAGYSRGEATGPSGMVSGQTRGERVRFRYHLLATDIETRTRGSTVFPTPLARQRTVRVIPALQSDVDLGASAQLKTNLYYDGSYIRYEDPSSPATRGRNHASQAGVENALLTGPWRVGISLKRSSYEQIGSIFPVENLGSASLSYLYSTTGDSAEGGWTVEPTIQGAAVSGFSPSLGGTLGIRRDISLGSAQGMGLFVRGAQSTRYPSLIDRFTVDATFKGNPFLRPERDTTVIAGIDYSDPVWSTSLEGYTQWRDDVLLLSYDPVTFRTITNAGTGRISALIHQLGSRPLGFIDFRHSFSLVDSQVGTSAQRFPYMPSWIHVVGADFHPVEDGGWTWVVSPTLRSAGDALVTTSTMVAGYTYLDLGGRVWVLGDSKSSQSNVSIGLNIENVFDRKIEIVKYYPSGRSSSFSLVATF